jgi:hypothetical protein
LPVQNLYGIGLYTQTFLKIAAVFTSPDITIKAVKRTATVQV